MVTDGVSFIAEYPLVARKSVIFWEKGDHWEFSPLGETAKKTSHTVSSFEQVQSTIELVRAGNIQDKTEEIEELIRAVRPSQHSAANEIVGLVLSDFGKQEA
jgi:hypothetical protein